MTVLRLVWRCVGQRWVKPAGCIMQARAVAPWLLDDPQLQQISTTCDSCEKIR
jgi:hypothetical protein